MAIEKVFKVFDFIEGIKAVPWTINGTRYKDNFPQNCNFCYAKGCYSADCNNFVKAFVWSRGEMAKNPGEYWYNPGRYGLGDVTCKELIEGCDDVSSDMSSTIAGEILYISDPNPKWGHIGVFVGDYTRTINGKNYTYNVVESSPAWRNGIQTTYMDANGNRYQCKGGEQKGRWEKHGKLKQVDYGVKTEPLEYTIKSGKDFATIDFDESGIITITVKGK
jgi:hypothetical protein